MHRNWYIEEVTSSQPPTLSAHYCLSLMYTHTYKQWKVLPPSADRVCRRTLNSGDVRVDLCHCVRGDEAVWPCDLKSRDVSVPVITRCRREVSISNAKTGASLQIGLQVAIGWRKMAPRSVVIWHRQSDSRRLTSHGTIRWSSVHPYSLRWKSFQSDISTTSR